MSADVASDTNAPRTGGAPDRAITGPRRASGSCDISGTGTPDGTLDVAATGVDVGDEPDSRTDPEPGASTARTLWRDGLWRANPGLVTLLGLCPLLATSNTTVNALGLGLATLATLLVTNVSVSALRHVLPPPVRLPAHVLIIASTVTAIELSMQAWLPGMHAALGIFLPLIVTNCLILGRAQAFASRRPVALAAVDALATGAGFLAVLVVLGASRELIGQGTLLADAPLLFGDLAQGWTRQVFASDRGLLLALLPPGAFIALGLLLAAHRMIDDHRSDRIGRRHHEE